MYGFNPKICIFFFQDLYFSLPVFFFAWKSLSLTKGVVFYFFPGKDTEPLTHSFLRFAVIFFSGYGKKNAVQKFQIIQVWASEPWWTPPKWQKNDLMGYIFEKIQIHNVLLDFFVIKMVIEDLLSVFFFSEKVGNGGKKKYRDFHSLTPLLRFPS